MRILRAEEMSLRGPTPTNGLPNERYGALLIVSHGFMCGSLGQALGYLCTTYGGYYKTKILRTYIRQRPRGWKMARKKEITTLSSRSFFTRTSCFTKEVLQRLALYRLYRMTPDRPHGRHDQLALSLTLPQGNLWIGSLSQLRPTIDHRQPRVVDLKGFVRCSCTKLRFALQIFFILLCTSLVGRKAAGQ